ncbi:MAG: hypothetical protein ACREAB_13615, partial [Blastocatellia bacterium]
MLGEMDIASLVKSFRRTGAQAAIDYLSKHTAGSNYPGANLLLLVDQFEELFHFGIETGDPKKRDEAADFVAIMLELAEQRAFPIYVVMTMRSDYLGECDNFYGLPEALNRSQYLVPRLTRQQRQQAIEGPIRLFGEKIAPRLVDRVLNDVGDQSDQLPVMQHALMRTWDNWRHGGGGSIDCPHYEKAGTIKRALSDDADSALVGMSDEERKITERLFQALTNVDTRNRRVRRQTHLSELQEITGAGREQLLKVINRFRGEGRCFLNIEDDKLTDDPLVDISHESLIRQWKQLDIWLNDESDWSDIYVRLADDAERYKKSQVDLWRDPQLQIALNWFADRRPNKAWGERYHPGFDAAIAFMEKSRAEREAEAERERARREKDLADALELDEMRRKQLRRNRFFSIFLFLSLLSSLVAGGYTFQLKAQAESAKADLEKSNKALDEARKGEEERSERFKNLALTNSKLLTESESQKRDLEAAKFNLTKALQAAEKSAAAERASADLANRAADEAKKQSKISRQHLAQLLGLHSVHLAPKGENDGAALEKRALLAAQSLRIKADGGEALPTVEGDRAAREILALAPRIVKTQRVGEYGSGASFSQDAKTLAALTFSKEARLIDTFTGAIKPGAEKLPAGAEQILISPDGKYLAISQPASQSLDAANMSANVSQISGAARSDIRIQVIETASGRALGQPVNPGGSTPGSGSTLKMLFSPDGFRLVTLTNTEAQLWETTTGKAIGNQRPDSVEETTQEPKQPNQAQRTPNITSRSLYQKSSASSSSKAVAAAFSPDGKTLATIHTNDPPYTRAIEPTGITSRIYFWNVETGARAADPIEADAERKSFFSAVAYSPDGKYLLTVRRGFSTPALIELWNPQTGKLIAEPMGWPNCKSVVFNRNGDEAAVVTDANTVVKLTILNDGGRILLRKGAPIYYGAEPHAVAFSDDGNQLIVVSKEGEVTISETKAEPVVANIPAAENTAMAFNPNGGLLATEDGIRGAIWNSMTKQLTEIPLLNAKDAIPPMAMAFSNGGRFLATVSDLFRIWDFNESQPINRSVKPSDRIRLAAFSRNADYLVMVGENGAAVGVASSGEGMLGAPTPPMKLPGLGAATKAIAVSPAHPRENRSVRYLASTDAGEAGGVARIREVIRDETGRSELGASLIVRHGAEITAMTFFRRGSWVLVTAGGNAVKFWNAQTGNQIGQTVEHDGKVNDFGFRSNQVMVTACQDGKIVVWVIQPNQSWLRDMTMDFGGPAERIVFGGNGAFMTVAGAGKARVWNTSTWRQIGRDMNIGEVVDIAPEVNSRGRFLSVAGENGMCGVWRSEAGQQTASSFRCAGAKDKAFFSPDGRWLLTGSVSFPRVWNMEGMTQPAGWIPTTALSHDGKYLASSYGRTIRVHSATDLREIYSGSLNGNVTQLAFDPAGGLTVVSRKPALQAQAGNPGAATDENEDVWIIETRNAESGAVISKTPDRP